MGFAVSVIIPVYNAEEYIENSVLSSAHLIHVKEIILVEDGSSDNSLEICKKLESEHKKVKLFQHLNNINLGAGATRNLGLQKVNSEFIAFLDADDTYLEHRFLKAKEILESHKDIEGVFEAIGTHFHSEKAKEIYTKGKLTTLNEDFLKENDYFTTLICGRGFTHLNGLTIRTNSIKNKVFFDESLRQSQDTDFLLQLALKCNMQAGNLKEPVAMRGVHETNRIHNISKADFYANILAQKWIRKAKNSNWSNRLIYNLVIMYIETSTRSKAIALIEILIKNPFLILKFNIFDFLKKLK